MAALASYLVAPGRGYLAWYPGLAGYLAGLAASSQRSLRGPHLLASVVMGATSPLVVYSGSLDLAVGLMSLSYFAAGTLAVYRGLRG